MRTVEEIRARVVHNVRKTCVPGTNVPENESLYQGKELTSRERQRSMLMIHRLPCMSKRGDIYCTAYITTNSALLVLTP